MVKETSTLNQERPTILDEKRRMERELGLPEEPPIVLPRSNNSKAGNPSIRKRFREWLSGSPQ